jgi:predicted ATP-dependent serine protease
MGNLISAHSVLKNKYKALEGLDPEWVKYIGLPSANFRMLVYGPSGSGKTTFVMELCVALSKLGKVLYNSSEQGEGKSIQDAFIRAKIGERCEKGSFMLGDRLTYRELVQQLSKKRSAPFVVIDSLQYMGFTKSQYKELVMLFPKKVFIIIAWSKGSKPEGEHAKGVEYFVDIKTYVDDGLVTSKSRFGETELMRLFPSKKAAQKRAQSGQDELPLLQNGQG